MPHFETFFLAHFLRQEVGESQDGSCHRAERGGHGGRCCRIQKVETVILLFVR